MTKLSLRAIQLGASEAIVMVLLGLTIGPRSSANIF